MKPLIFIIGLVIGCTATYLVMKDTGTAVVSEKWVHDTTYVKPDTVFLKGDLRYVTLTDVVKEFHLDMVHDTFYRETNAPEGYVVAHVDTILGRSHDSVRVVVDYGLPPINRFRIVALWNQDSYKVVTVEKKNKFEFGAQAGAGLTTKGFGAYCGLGVTYRFTLKDLF